MAEREPVAVEVEQVVGKAAARPRLNVLGAARLVAESGEEPAVLRQKVCSPGGTTLAGLTALEDGNLKATLIEAVARATRRSKELGQAT